MWLVREILNGRIFSTLPILSRMTCLDIMARNCTNHPESLCVSGVVPILLFIFQDLLQGIFATFSFPLFAGVYFVLSEILWVCFNMLLFATRRSFAWCFLILWEAVLHKVLSQCAEVIDRTIADMPRGSPSLTLHYLLPVRRILYPYVHKGDHWCLYSAKWTHIFLWSLMHILCHSRVSRGRSLCNVCRPVNSLFNPEMLSLEALLFVSLSVSCGLPLAFI